jgi:hypothetical protein
VKRAADIAHCDAIDALAAVECDDHSPEKWEAEENNEAACHIANEVDWEIARTMHLMSASRPGADLVAVLARYAIPPDRSLEALRQSANIFCLRAWSLRGRRMRRREFIAATAAMAVQLQ